MTNPENDILNLIVVKNRRLQILKKQEAYYGKQTPPHISMEIEDVEEDLQKLRKQFSMEIEGVEEDLQELRKQLKATLQLREEADGSHIVVARGYFKDAQELSKRYTPTIETPFDFNDPHALRLEMESIIDDTENLIERKHPNLPLKKKYPVFKELLPGVAVTVLATKNLGDFY